jgi:tRNA G10  N-methylase Trm11
MQSLNDNSWIHLSAQDARYTLPAAGLAAAADCGWVEQMLPFIETYSANGQVVLDPFCGWGTTMLAAGLLGRSGIGVEIDLTRVEAARRRLAHHGIDAQIIHGNSTALPFYDKSIDVCLTSVPYFGPWFGDQKQQTNADSGQCYAQRNYETYLRLLDRIFEEVARVLRPGAFFIAMVENLRVDGHFLPLAWDCARQLERYFVLGDERILTYTKDSLSGRSLTSNRAHEYALICRK